MTIATISLDEVIIINQAKKIIANHMNKGKKISSPKDVTDYFILNFGLYEYEVFGVLYLNQQNQFIKFEELFRGTINETSVYPREIAKQTLIYNATSVILVHNHPSGECKPSQQDIQLTHKIEQVLSLIDVTVLDHFIVAKHNFLSLKENGYY